MARYESDASPRWCSLLPVRLSEPYLSRRALIAGAVGGVGLLSLAGCELGTDQPRPTSPDPLEPILAAAVYLANRYATAATTVPDLASRLTPLRDVHKAHITALTRELGTVDSGVLPSAMPPSAAPASSASRSASPGPNRSATASASAPTSRSASPSRSAGTGSGPPPLPTERTALLADLRALERTGAQQAAAACLAGPGYRAALLGSIAAARASNAEVLT